MDHIRVNPLQHNMYSKCVTGHVMSTYLIKKKIMLQLDGFDMIFK